MNEAGRFVCRREGSLSVWRCFVVLVVSGVLTGFAQAQEESYTRIVERWECKTFAVVEYEKKNRHGHDGRNDSHDQVSAFCHAASHLREIT